FALSLDGDAMRWEGQVGPHRVAGRATIEEGNVPYTATLGVRFADLSELFQTFLPDAELRGGALEADVAVSGDLLHVAESEGSVSFSQDARVIDEMHGKVNNGEAKVSGGVSLRRFVPQKIDLAAHLGEVGVRLQDNLNATLEGDVTLFGPPLEPVVGGSVTL